MQAVLVMFRADGERRNFPLTRNMTVIGRREDCDLRIPLGDVSRKHCRLLINDEHLSVEDLGSSNGTYHNGQRVQQASLGAGDTLRIGPVTFVVQIDGVPGDDELKPAIPETNLDELASAPGAEVESGVTNTPSSDDSFKFDFDPNAAENG